MQGYYLLRFPFPPWGYRLFQFSFIRNGQLLATFLAAAGQHFAAIGRFHTLAETMYGFTTAAMWLKSTFHNLTRLSKFENRFRFLKRATMPVG